MTLLVGSQTQTVGDGGDWESGANPSTIWQPFTAVANGTLSTLSIAMHGGSAGGHVFLGIYNSAGTILLDHIASALSIASAGIVAGSVVNGASIVLGTSYVIAAQFDVPRPDIWENNDGTYVVQDGTTQVLGTLPAALTSSNSNGEGLIAMWGASAASGPPPSQGFFGASLLALGWVIERRRRLSRERALHYLGSRRRV